LQIIYLLGEFFIYLALLYSHVLFSQCYDLQKPKTYSQFLMLSFPFFLAINDDCDLVVITSLPWIRCKGKERLLDKRCGTLPYVAPEVLQKAYHAQPADLWSCGVILVTMLAGGKCGFGARLFYMCLHV